jgi:hypothetical protein
MGTNKGWAVYGEFGQELATYGANFGYIKQLTKTERFFSSVGGEVSVLFPLEKSEKFNALRLSGEYTLSYYNTNWFGIYTPIKLSGVWYRWAKNLWTEKAAGLALLPGLGITFDFKHFIIRGAGNFGFLTFSKDGFDFFYTSSDFPKIKSYEVAPYIGLLLAYRW